MPAWAARACGGALVVAGEHGDLVAVGTQAGDHLGGLGAQVVADGDGADHDPVVLDQHRGGTRFLHAR